MPLFWQTLITNLALVTLVLSLWTQGPWRLNGLRGKALFGLLIGAGAVATMLFSVSLRPGVIFDLRGPLLVAAGFVGGPISAVIATVIAAGCRLMLGGAGTVPGLLGIGMTLLVGLVAHYLTARRGKTVLQLLIVSIVAAPLSVIGVIALPHAMMMEALRLFGAPIAALSFAASFLAGNAIIRREAIADEHDLLRAAAIQAPDFYYVKNRRAEFVTVNKAVAGYNGYAHGADMVGLTDRDLTDMDRANELIAAEMRVMRTGTALVDVVESVPTDGVMRIFSTTKVPLRNRTGTIIGLAGVTRDVTDEKHLEKQLTESRNLLNFALAEMSDGLALFDADGYLTFANEQYGKSFPRTGEIRRPGANIREILKEVVESGEQLGITEPAIWIEQIATSLQTVSEEQVALFDGRWLHIKTRPTSDGGSLVVVSDVTRFKEAEANLKQMTDQLMQQATTDSLTGLINRRALDQALETELARGIRNRTSTGLLMIDVDRFKAYNDRYGHLAGDNCLKQVAVTLKGVIKRPADTVARYGGEEFVVILPETDEDGTFFIAEQFRKTLMELALPHESSEKGVVTVSIGVSPYRADESNRSAAELVGRADEALYEAKTAGRNRVTGWRQRHQVRRAGNS